jgi:hypothetical protein
VKDRAVLIRFSNEIAAVTREPMILHTFAGGRDGDTPNGDFIVDRKSDLYGTKQLLRTA